MPGLSIIIPCYKEARRIPKTLPRLAAYLAELSQRGITHEVLLVVESSPDNTLALAQQFAAANPGWQAIDNQIHRGKGYAVRSGMKIARGDITCFMDADLSTDPSAISDALTLLEQHPEISMIAGDRRHVESHVIRHQGKSRVTLSGIFNKTTRMLFPCIQIKDTQCGFKMFRAVASTEIFSRARINGFAFDVEIFQLAHQLGYRMHSMPVHWTDAPHSTVRALRHGAQMYRDLLRLRFGRKKQHRKRDS